MAGDNRASDADGHGTPPRGLIEHYEVIAAASRRMLEAAHRGDWVQVEAIESSCRDMILALKVAARSDRLSDAEKRRRMSLLRSILEDDAQIRLRAEPWLRDLEEFLAAPRNSARNGP